MLKKQHDNAHTFTRGKLPACFLQRLILCYLILTGFLLPLHSSEAGAEEPTATNPAVLEVFVRQGCPHCAEAKKFLATFSKERPQLQIVFRAVDKYPQASRDLVRHSRSIGAWPPGVPTFVIQNRVHIGFNTAEDSGPKLIQFIEGVSETPNSIETELLGTLSVERLGLPLFTLALGLLDGFNPCAMWVLLFLLSLLVHLHNRKRMALIAGTFVLVSGSIYYLFMAAWLNVFLLVGLSSFFRLALACLALIIGVINVKDFIKSDNKYSLSIPGSAKPGLYARMRNIINADSLLLSLIGVATLAVIVNFIELLCTAGLPAIYTAILTQQGLSDSSYYSYIGLYIFGYIADDILMVTLAVIALSSNKLTEQTGRWLKLLSGTIMIMLGCIMIFRPD